MFLSTDWNQAFESKRPMSAMASFQKARTVEISHFLRKKPVKAGKVKLKKLQAISSDCISYFRDFFKIISRLQSLKR